MWKIEENEEGSGREREEEEEMPIGKENIRKRKERKEGK
jgi:hypothetical protein